MTIDTDAVAWERAKVAVIVVGPVIVVAHAPVPAHAVPPGPIVHATKRGRAGQRVERELVVVRDHRRAALGAADAGHGCEHNAGARVAELDRHRVPDALECRGDGRDDVDSHHARDVTLPHPPPLQPVNSAPASGVAVNVTVVPAGKLALQTAPQAMAPTLDDTVPLAVPFRTTVRVAVAGSG